jgi:excisionase family DNA binding protein
MDAQITPQLHALGAVSARTSLSRSALYREIRAGRLRAVKIGKSLRISESDLQDFIGSLEAASTALRSDS